VIQEVQLISEPRYGWIMVAVSFVIMGLQFGALVSISVFLKPLVAEFGWERGNTAFAYTAGTGAVGLGGIVMGWMADRFSTRPIVLFGSFLQYVLVQQRPVGKPFKHTRKRFNKGMLPLETAEVILDEIGSDQLLLNFQVIENIPAKMNGHDGFRLVYTYKDKDGLELKTIYYGFITGEWFYNIRYTAAKRHYFEKDIETFGKILNSFKLLKSQPA
jgi:hypothetical protein